MKKIILCDEDYLIRKAMNAIISKNNHLELVASLSSSLDLIEYCQTYQPDILFMDILEKNHLSIHIVKIIRKKFPNIAIYIVTNHNDFETVQTFLQIGVEEYILKPLSFSKILSVFSEFESKHSTNFAEELCELVLSKDFHRCYKSIPRLEEAMRKGMQENKEVTKRNIEQMIDEALRLMNCTDKEHRNYYYDKLMFTDATLEQKFPTRFLLFDLFDEIFKQRTIQKKPQLAKFFFHISENLYEDILLYETANECDISQGYLSRVLKEQFQLSFNTYVQIKKMELAKQALYFNDDKIIDVAFQLSYSESSYFCKVFKRIVGVTAARLKKEMKKDSKII